MSSSRRQSNIVNLRQEKSNIFVHYLRSDRLSGGCCMYNQWVKLTIPIPEKVSLNKIYSGIHFRTRIAHKDSYRLAVQVAKPKPYDGPFPVHCHYHFRLAGSRLDLSNHAYMLKMIEDGLVNCGVLPGDEPKYVCSYSVSAEKIGKANENEVHVTIESV